MESSKDRVFCGQCAKRNFKQNVYCIGCDNRLC